MNPEALFTALSHPLRLKCTLLLSLHGECCVCELTEALNAAQPVVSRHLSILRTATVVSDRRVGTWVYYRLNPDLPSWTTDVIVAARQGLESEIPWRATLTRASHRPICG